MRQIKLISIATAIICGIFLFTDRLSAEYLAAKPAPQPFDNELIDPQLSSADIFQTKLRSGHVFYKSGNYQKALKLYQDACSLNPDSVEAAFYFGQTCHKLNMNETGLKFFQERVKNRPFSAKDRINLAIAYQWTDQTDDEIKEYNQAIRLLNPLSPKDKKDLAVIYSNLGLAYMNKGERSDQIKKAFSNAITYNPGLFEAHYNLGVLYHLEGYYNDALHEFNEALKIYPNDIDSLIYAGLTYDKLNFNDEALNCYKKAGELMPDRADIYTNTGILYEKIGQEDLAAKFYATALNIDKKLYIPGKNLALYYAKKKDYETAITHLNYLRTLYPEDPKLYYYLGVVQFEQKHYQAAIDSLNRSIQISPALAYAYFYLGLIHENLNDTKKALEYYKRSVSLDKKLAEGYANIGLIYLDRKNEKDALKYFRKAIESSPNLYLPYLKSAEIYQKMEQPELAIESYKKAYLLNPQKEIQEKINTLRGIQGY